MDICLRNHSVKVTLPHKTAMGKITTANVISPWLAPQPARDGSGGGQTTVQKKKGACQEKLLDKLDLMGFRDWSLEEQNKEQGLLTEYASIFAEWPAFGQTSLVKHSIRLTDNTPFKNCYWKIPPSMYEEVREHLREMLEIVQYGHSIVHGLVW